MCRRRSALAAAAHDELDALSGRRAPPIILVLQLAVALSWTFFMGATVEARRDALDVLRSFRDLELAAPDLEFPGEGGALEIRALAAAISALRVPLEALSGGGIFSLEAARVVVEQPATLVVVRRTAGAPGSGSYWGPPETVTTTLHSDADADAWLDENLGNSSNAEHFVEAMLQATLSAPMRLRLLGDATPEREAIVEVFAEAAGQGVLALSVNTQVGACTEACRNGAREAPLPATLGVAIAGCVLLLVQLALRFVFARSAAAQVAAVAASAAAAEALMRADSSKARSGVASLARRAAGKHPVPLLVCCPPWLRGARRSAAGDAVTQHAARQAFLAICGSGEAGVAAAAALVGALACACSAMGPSGGDALLASAAGRYIGGAASAAAWISLVRAARHRPACGAAQRTLVGSSSSLFGFLAGASPLFLAFVAFAVASVGGHAARFATIAGSARTLFAVVNGDVMRDTFLAAAGGDAQPEWAALAATAFLFVFVILMLFIVLTSCVSLLEEAFVLARPAHDVPLVEGGTSLVHTEHVAEGHAAPQPQSLQDADDPWSRRLAPLRSGRSRVLGARLRACLSATDAPWWVF